MYSAINNALFCIHQNITLPQTFFAFVMNDVVTGNFISGSAQSRETKWVQAVAMAALRTSAEFFAVRLVYFFTFFQYRSVSCKVRIISP